MTFAELGIISMMLQWHLVNTHTIHFVWGKCWKIIRNVWVLMECFTLNGGTFLDFCWKVVDTCGNNEVKCIMGGTKTSIA
jgi:hypothetical protein